MTREEQRLVRELKKPLEKCCKEIGRRRGWKTIAGVQYHVREGMLYMLYANVPPVDRGQALKANFSCKPPALDEMYWTVFHMAEEAAKQPFSFHVNGAFTAPRLWLPPWREPLPAPEDLETAAERIFDRAEALEEENAFPALADYRARLEADKRGRTLEIVLCLLCEGRYEEALGRIDAGLSAGEDGGYLRLGGPKGGILADARSWCMARLEESL